MEIIDLINITLHFSSVSQSAYDLFTMAGTWNSGEYVQVENENDDSTPRYPVEVYISTENANSGNYPPDSPTKWTLVGCTNRWEMFDGFVNTQTSDTSDIAVEIDSGNTNRVGLFGLQGSDVTLAQIEDVELATVGDCATDQFSKETGWSYDAGNGEYDCDGSQTGDSRLYQDMGSVSGRQYLVKFTVKNYSAGNIAGLAGGTAGTDVSENGDYVQVITAGSGAYDGVVADADFVGSVDDISVMRIIKRETVGLSERLTPDWWEWYFADFEYKQDILWTYPIKGTGRLRIEISTQGGAAACGMVQPGKSYTLGTTYDEPQVGISDYSDTEEDSAGRDGLVEGPYAKRIDFDFWLPRANVDKVFRRLASFRGRAVICNANNTDQSYEFESLMAYGVIQDWEEIIRGSVSGKSKCSIEFKGII